MQALRLRLVAGVAAAVMAWPVAVMAQDEPDAEADDNGEPVEEIVVIARKRGDPVDIDERYEALLRKRILDDYRRRQRLEEREMWRNELEAEFDEPSRISWGYDPAAELRMRQQTDMMDLPFEQNRPATLFRIGF